MKKQFDEGPKAQETFESTMTALFQVKKKGFSDKRSRVYFRISCDC